MSLRKIDGVVIDADTLDGDQLATITAAIATAVADEATARDIAIAAAVADEATARDVAIAAWSPETVLLYKAADEVVNNNNVLQNDDDLHLTVGANDVWFIHLFMYVLSETDVPDMQYRFTVPSGGAVRIHGFYTKQDTPSSYVDGTVVETLAIAAAEKYIGLHAVYIGGGTAGTLQLQWAQVTATVEDTRMKAHSFMLCHKLAE